MSEQGWLSGRKGRRRDVCASREQKGCRWGGVRGTLGSASGRCLRLWHLPAPPPSRPDRLRAPHVLPPPTPILHTPIQRTFGPATAA